VSLYCLHPRVFTFFATLIAFDVDVNASLIIILTMYYPTPNVASRLLVTVYIHLIYSPGNNNEPSEKVMSIHSTGVNSSKTEPLPQRLRHRYPGNIMSCESYWNTYLYMSHSFFLCLSSSLAICRWRRQCRGQ
jgi:hypothetical protein